MKSLFLIASVLLCTVISDANAEIIMKSEVVEQRVVSTRECEPGPTLVYGIDRPTYFASVNVCNLKRVWLVDDGGVFGSEQYIKGSMKLVYELDTIVINAVNSDILTERDAKLFCQRDLAQYKYRVTTTHNCLKL